MKPDPEQLARLARRERRLERRRTEILDAAAQVFADKSYESTTTRDIAAAVDIGESTLYNYFANKREILWAIIKLKGDEMESFLSQIGPVADRAGLVHLLDQTLALLHTRVHFSRTFFGEALHDPEIYALLRDRLERIRRCLQANLERGIQNGQLRAIDAGLTAQLILGMVFSLNLPWLFGAQQPPTPEQRQQQAEALAEVLLRGIANLPKTAKH